MSFTDAISAGWELGLQLLAGAFALLILFLGIALFLLVAYGVICLVAVIVCKIQDGRKRNAQSVTSALAAQARWRTKRTEGTSSDVRLGSRSGETSDPDRDSLS